MTAASARISEASSTLPGLLARLHSHWLGQVSTILEPAIAPTASFWDGWGVARYLCDQFEGRYRLERELMESLTPVLLTNEVVRLRAEDKSVEHLRAMLIAAARHRLDGAPVAALSRMLMHQLRRWCTRLEVAVEGLTMADLPPEARRSLGRMEVADDVSL